MVVPTLLSIVLSLFCLFLVQLFLELRRVARNVGSVRLRPLNDQLINLYMVASSTETSLVDSSFLPQTLRQLKCFHGRFGRFAM